MVRFCSFKGYYTAKRNDKISKTLNGQIILFDVDGVFDKSPSLFQQELQKEGY